MNVLVFLIILAVFLGTNFLFVGFFMSLQSCPPPRVEYRFIPRTFNEEMENPVSVIDQLQSIFDTRPLLS